MVSSGMRRSLSASRYPRSARTSAVLRPIPCAAPVTTATCFSGFNSPPIGSLVRVEETISLYCDTEIFAGDFQEIVFCQDAVFNARLLAGSNQVIADFGLFRAESINSLGETNSE